MIFLLLLGQVRREGYICVCVECGDDSGGGTWKLDSVLRNGSSVLSLQHLGNDHSSKVCSRVSTLPYLNVFALQIDGSPIPEVSSAKRRPRRMTPFWRGVSLRPIGASCRDDSECITRLCRKRRCSLSVVQEWCTYQGKKGQQSPLTMLRSMEYWLAAFWLETHKWSNLVFLIFKGRCML